MENRETQIIIEHHRLFSAGPRTSSLSFTSGKVRSDLLQFCQLLREKLGAGKTLTVYPHRILHQGMWSVQLAGEQDKVYLLLSIAGRFKLSMPADNTPWPVRWQIDVADHIDAYWFIELLAQELELQRISACLSTEDVDNAVTNEGENRNDTREIKP